MRSFLVVGRVVDAKTGRIVRDGEVQLWQPRPRSSIAVAAIDDRGMFHFELSEERLNEALGATRGRAEFDVRVSRNGHLLRAAGGPVRWRLPAERTFLRVAVDVPSEVISRKRIVVGSYDDLLEREAEILERINGAPSGPHRFLLEPFRLLADIGVRVTPTAREEILTRHPGLRSVSATPYEALTRSTRHQPLRFRLRGLRQRARSVR